MTHGKGPTGRKTDDSRDAMQRARGGDREAFGLLVNNYANMVTGLALKLLGSREEALDCAQDAFVRAWEKVDRYDDKWSVATWLRRIVTNLALDRLRRRKRRQGFPDGLDETLGDGREGPDEAAQRHERAGQVRKAIAELPEKYKIVLVLRDMEGAEIAEIAEITGTNAATVRWRLHRARALFRDMWSAQSDQEQ